MGNTIVSTTGTVVAGHADDLSEPVKIGGSDGTNVRTLLTAADGSLIVSSSGADTTQVVGNVASGATDSGNPVKTASKYNATQPTFTDGQRGDSQMDTRGNTKVTLMGKDGVAAADVTVNGDVASGSADSGNPLKIGGVLRTTQPTLTDGQRGDAQADTRGNLKVTLMGLNGVAASDVTVQGDVASGGVDSGNPLKVGGIVSGTAGTIPNLSDLQRGNISLTSEGAVLIAAAGGPSDGATNTAALYRKAANNSAAPLAGAPMLFNGATWDRQRGNMDGVVLVAAGTYVGTQNAADQTNYNHRGVVVVYDVTAVTAVGSFTITIQGKDPTSGKYYTILAGAARSTTGTDVLTVYPGNTVTANLSVSTVLPRTWRAIATFNSGTNQTFTLTASLIL